MLDTLSVHVVKNLLEIYEKQGSASRTLLKNDPDGFDVVSVGGTKAETSLPSVGHAFRAFFEGFQDDFDF